MNVARILIVAVVGLLASVPWAGAQPQDQRHKWWQDEKSKAQLGLSAEQSGRIEEVFQAWMARMTPVLEELNRREKQASALFLKADTSEADVMRQAEQVERIRGQMSRERTLMLFRCNRILSPDQRVKFKEMYDNRERDRGRRAPSPVKK